VPSLLDGEDDVRLDRAAEELVELLELSSVNLRSAGVITTCLPVR
jgi:hypothetical protein